MSVAALRPILAAVAVLALIANPVSCQLGDEHDVRYRSGTIELAALLLVPPGLGPHPAAVIIQGSGSSDRTNAWARDMAHALVEMGFAALLTDKRGSGASGGDWRTASFDDLARDALAGVTYLQGRADIDPRRVGLVGMSQGGQVAPVAASRSGDVAFVVAVSSKAVGFAEGTFIEMANTARQAGLSDEDVRVILSVNAAALNYLATDNWDAYATRRAEALEGATRAVAAGFPGEPDAPIWTFYRHVRLHDPLVHWVHVRQPVLIVYGADDEQDNTPVAESVRRLEYAFKSVGRDDWRILVVPGSGHAIRDPISHHLATRFLAELREFLVEHVVR